MEMFIDISIFSGDNTFFSHFFVKVVVVRKKGEKIWRTRIILKQI